MTGKRRSGFILIEIMIVVVMIGLLAAMATPAFQRVREHSQNKIFANDARVFAGQLETFVAETGTFPENSAPGAIPSGFGPDIRTEQWTSGTSIGGNWDVEVDASGIKLAIGASGYNVSNEQLLKFDEDNDNGNLSTGNFRNLGANGYYLVVSE